MAETRDRGEERPVVTSAVWPVPRAVVIRRDGDERGMLKAYLDHYRETFELKCAGGSRPAVGTKLAAVDDELARAGTSPRWGGAVVVRHQLCRY
jgi:hypothetical protein